METCAHEGDYMTDHQLAIRLRQYADIFNSAPVDVKDKSAITLTAADLLEAAKRLDQLYERRNSAKS